MVKKKHRYVAHEVLLTSAKLNFTKYLHVIIACLVLQVLFLITIGFIKIQKVMDIKVPLSNKPISMNSIIQYSVNLNFFQNGIVIPVEFEPLIKKSKLQKYIVSGNKINRSLFKKVFDSVSNNQLRLFLPSLLKYFYYSFAFYLFGFFYLRYSLKESKDFYKTEFVRGSKLKDFESFSNELKENAEKEFESDLESFKFFENHDLFNIDNLNLKISGLYFPRQYECKHLLILGATGTGKSVLLNQLIDQILKRQELIKNKNLFYDMKGEFASKFYDESRGDAIYYPFDSRSLQWSIFSDIYPDCYEDFEMISNNIFQFPEDDKNKYWYNCAGEIFRAGLLYLHKMNRKKNRDILEFFNQPLQIILDDLNMELPILEKGALKHIDRKGSPASSSVISILAERLRFFRYIIDHEGSFSFRAWIRGETNVSNLFLLNIYKNEEIFKPLMSLIIEICMREILSLLNAKVKNLPKFNFLIDEFGSLSKLLCIVSYLRAARSFGGSLILANQDLGSITEVYGENLKTSIFNNFNSLVCLGLNDPNTARFISDSIGQQEILKKTDSHQMSPNDIGDRVSINTNEKIEQVVLPSEFLNLPIFEGFLKITGKGSCKIKVEEKFFEPICPEYIPIKVDVKERLELSEKEIQLQKKEKKDRRKKYQEDPYDESKSVELIGNPDSQEENQAEKEHQSEAEKTESFNPDMNEISKVAQALHDKEVGNLFDSIGNPNYGSVNISNSDPRDDFLDPCSENLDEE